MQISEIELEREYHVFTDDELQRLGVTRRVFYINTQAPSDEVRRRLAEFRDTLGAS